MRDLRAGSRSRYVQVRAALVPDGVGERAQKSMWQRLAGLFSGLETISKHHHGGLDLAVSRGRMFYLV